MPGELVEIRILPPFGIGRLGSSPSPMDNYELQTDDPIGRRLIIPAETLIVNDSGEISSLKPPFEVNFRDEKGFIRPVCPFLEIWARFSGEEDLIPLTENILSGGGFSLADVKWKIDVANIKAYRRTGDTRDRIVADLPEFSDHAVKPLMGVCKNFFATAFIPFGSVRYIKPNDAFPEIRLRFTPAAGKVYGPPSGFPKPDENLAGIVYDDVQGGWKGYFDRSDNSLKARQATNPGSVYAGWADPDNQYSWGYLDDECDGVVQVSIGGSNTHLRAYARIAAGPPSFAPDSLPVRTVGDELEQAMFGPDLDGPATDREIDSVREILRRALDTVRLMNTAQMNAFSTQPGVGMARMDFLDVGRAQEPIVDPTLTDTLAIQARHERILLALESGSLVWFARVLREHDAVGDLSTDGRRKMPALMRGADARYLALTRRQVNKVRAAASVIAAASELGDKS